MHNKIIIAQLALSSALALAGLGRSAHATEANTAAGTADVSTEDQSLGTLQEIVITAQRRSEDAQKTALSLQVLNAAELERAGTTDVFALNAEVPGLQVASTGSILSVFIRGVGSYVTNPLGDSAVALNVDGIYVANTTSLSADFFDLARIEVLKGPQGTLYGRNATAGALNVITQAPVLNKEDGYVEVEGGNYSLARVTAAVNVPVGQTFAVRGAFQIVDHSGYLDTGEDDQKDRTVRLRALWEPTDDVSLSINTDYGHSGGRGNGLTKAPPLDPRHPWNALGDTEGNAYLIGIFPLQTPTNGRASFQDNDFTNVSAELDWNVGFATVTLLPAYRHVSEDYLIDSGFLYYQKNQSNQRSFEARLGNAGDRIKWVVGAYYFNEDQATFGDANASALILSSTPIYDTTDQAPAGFGELTFSLTDSLRLIAGARYTDEKKSILGFLDDFAILDNPPGGGPIANPYGGPSGRLAETITGEKSFSSTTWKGGVEYDLAPQSLLFATAATGFKSGGFYAGAAGPNPADPENSYQPEKLTAYTVGSRNRFLDNRLQVNAEAYYWDYKNKQESALAIDPSGIFGLRIFNAATATLKGVSLDAQAAVSPRDTVSAFAEYNDATYGRFTYGEPTAFFAPVGTGCAYGPGAPGQTEINCSGKPLIHAPRWTGSAAYEHRFPMLSGSTLTVHVDGQASAPYYLATVFTPDSHAPGYVLGNASLSFDPVPDHWLITAWIRNFTNRPVYTGGSQAPLEPTVQYTSIGPPRTFGLRARYSF